VLATEIVDFEVGINESSALLRPLALVIPWSEVAIAILLLFPLRWVVFKTGAILIVFLSLGGRQSVCDANIRRQGRHKIARC